VSEPPDPQRPASAAPTEEQLDREMPGGSESAGHDPYAALRIPDYWFYCAGWVISVLGQQVQSVAVQWQIFQKMGSGSRGALALGLVGGVQALPVILLALPAGHLADRFDRRRIVMASQLFAFLCSLALAAVTRADSPVWSLYLLLGLAATGQAIIGRPQSGWSSFGVAESIRVP